MLKVYSVNDSAKLKEYVSEDIFNRLHENRNMCIPINNDSYFIFFHYTNVHNITEKDQHVCIFLSRKDLIFVCDSSVCKKAISKIPDYTNEAKKSALVPEFFNTELQLYDFFINLIEDDVYEMEKVENLIVGLEDELLGERKLNSNSSKRIIKLRRELLKFKRYYEQLALITSELADNEENIISAKVNRHFIFLDKRIDKLLNSVLHLREYIEQVQESYQSQIDIEQNITMKVFTVVTSIFLPLTLIVGWYGMNLQMPEFKWAFGYPFVIILSTLILLSCLIIFKIKKWF